MKRAPAALVLAVAAASPAAWAVERENAIGADPTATMIKVSDKSSPDVGGGVGLHYTYGITDAFNFVADGGWSLVALDEKLWD
ncbi:MAG TPA: hypothetical protein VIY73_00980, partial [Polyangiaceae bacterium]